MKNRMTIRVLSVAVLLPLLLTVGDQLVFPTRRSSASLGRQDEDQDPKQAANADDTVTGRVVREDAGNEIEIDASGCKGKNIVRFVAPYKKEVLGTITCTDEATSREKVYEKAQVTQKKD